MTTPEIEAFWQAYCASLPADAPVPPTYSAWAFGDNPALADELCALVLAGVKTGTCCSLNELQASGDSLPYLGELSVILDGAGQPVGIIETVEIHALAFNQVDAELAAAEGEGDRSLADWRIQHERYFRRTHSQFGLPFDEQIPLIYERFRLVFPLKTEG